MIEKIQDQRKGYIIASSAVLIFLALTFFIWKIPLSRIIASSFYGFGSALTAVALVLMYRTARFINFAQIALGAVAAQLFFEFYTRGILPYPFALLLSLLAGVLVSVIIGLIASLLFFKHPRLVMSVVSIVFLGLIGYISTRVNTAFIKPGEIRHIDPILGPWPNKTFTIGVIPFRFAHLVALLALLSISVGLIIFFRRTRIGIAVRASAENSDRAALLGINVKALQVGVWAIVGLIASVATLANVSSGIDTYNQGALVDTIPLLLPLAAAVIARMQSMPIAYFTAFGMMMLSQFIGYHYNDSTWVNILLFAGLVLSLLLQRSKLNARQDDGSSWKAVREVRPTPREMLQVPGIARSRRIIFFLLAVVALGIPFVVSLGTTATLSVVWVTAMVGLSLVLLTGWSGQISLGQFAFVSIGAFLAGNMTLRWGIPFWFALPLAGLLGAGFAVIIGLPALRIRGLFLAVSTFALAVVMPTFIYEPRFLGKWVPGAGVERPKFFFLNFTDQRSMYYLCFVLFVLVMLAVLALRKSRGGRVLIALRDNEAGVQSFGVDVVRTRLAAFAMSGFIASFAGALLVHLSLGMDDRTIYSGQASIQIFILVVLGGISSPLGAVLGSVYFIAGLLFFPGLVTLLTGVGGLVVLMFIPGGLSQIVFGARDAILRVVAMRQHIIVPSLFADYSPDAWEKRLAPLTPAVQSQGLATLKPDQRYKLPSRIFGRSAVEPTQ